MLDPVVNAEGQTYERRELLKAFRYGALVDPVTRTSLFTSDVVPNVALRSQIRELVTKHGVPAEWREFAETTPVAELDRATVMMLYQVGIVTENTRAAHDACYSDHDATLGALWEQHAKLLKSVNRAVRALHKKRKLRDDVKMEIDSAQAHLSHLHDESNKLRVHLGEEPLSVASAEDTDDKCLALDAGSDDE